MAGFSNPGKVTVKGQRADSEQLRVLGRALSLADRWGVKSYKARKALIEALIVESEARNLRTASADGYGSYGVLQGRTAYHSKRDLMDPAYQIGVFLGHGRGGKATKRRGFTGRGNARQLAKSGMTSGQVAQAIEGSAYPDRYDQHSREAAKILKLWQSGGGGGGGARRGPRAASAGSTVERSTSTRIERDFDEESYRAARRRAVVAQMLSKRNPNHLLLKTGTISPEQPSPADYTSEREVIENTSTIRQGRKTEDGGTSTSRGSAATGRGSWGKQGLSPLNELFYDPQGGWDRPSGTKKATSIGAIGGHSDHVHVAAGPETVKRLMKRARRLGLKISSYKRPEDTDSFHSRDMAFDAEGPPDKMAAFTRYMRRLYALDKR